MSWVGSKFGNVKIIATPLGIVLAHEFPNGLKTFSRDLSTQEIKELNRLLDTVNFTSEWQVIKPGQT